MAAGTDIGDEELAERARAGDERAVETLLDRWLPRLRARARRALHGIVRRRVAESDVVQEACLTASVRMADFEDRGEGSFGRWLAKILDNKLRDQFRRHVGSAKRNAGLEVSQAEGGLEHLVASPAASPSVEAMGVEQRDALSRALARLPEHYRVVLRLVHEERLPLVEVGRQVGRSENATCKVYGRAVEKLGQYLREAEGGS